MNSIDENTPPTLSAHALEALKEFYQDRDARQQQFEKLKTKAEDDATASSLTMDTFEEDWNASQFWYSQETATLLANQLLHGADSSTTIAVVSAPSVFVQLKNIISYSGLAKDKIPKIYLLEFDERFNVFPEFVFYDFHHPFKLSAALKGSIDYIICDPPFLSEDCQTKAAMTVRWLSKSWGEAASDSPQSAPRTIVCTGERMEEVVTKLYRPQGVKTTTFEPNHAKGLSNEFRCYANYECDDWTWRQ